jgi:hypothetical protein
METTDNEGGGKTVTLVKGDDLAKVPKTHRHLVSAGVTAAFEDVPAYLRSLSRKCPFPAMAGWLKTMADDGTWSLKLAQGFSTDYCLAGFDFQHETIRTALLAPARDSPLPPLPKALAKFYQLADQVCRGGFGVGGGIVPPSNHGVIGSDGHDSRGDVVDLDVTVAWGSTGCGDMLVYTPDGRAGWFNHESHEVVLRGKIPDVIDEVFSTMLAGETPELRR